jgi:hypothetical protein
MGLDFDHRAIYVRNGKEGGKDRAVTLADEIIIHCNATLKRYECRLDLLAF